MNKTLQVQGMTCGHCKAKVEKSLVDLSEISSAEVDLIDGTVEINGDEEINDDKLIKTIYEAGYKLVSIEDDL
jgi:copper chaperone CopZ